MKRIFWIILTVMALGTGAADLQTKSGQLYRNFKIKSADGEKISIVYLLPDGSPDSAVIAWEDLPDELARLLTSQERKTPVPVGFEPSLTVLGNQLEQALAAVPLDDRVGRAALLADVRAQARQLAVRYSETADFKFISSDENGVLAQVIGTGKGGILKSGDYVYLMGAKPPATRQFRLRVYPASGRGTYGSYNNVWYYGISEAYALQNMLDYLGTYIGNPTLFRPAAAPVQQDMYVDNSTVNNVTNIYVRPRSPYWGWGYVAPVYVSSSLGRMNTPGEKVGKDGNSVRQTIQVRSPGKGTRVSMPVPVRFR